MRRESVYVATSAAAPAAAPVVAPAVAPAAPQLVAVRFDSLPSGGVYADGRSAELCKTPCAFNIAPRRSAGAGSTPGTRSRASRTAATTAAPPA